LPYYVFVVCDSITAAFYEIEMSQIVFEYPSKYNESILLVIEHDIPDI
jgi:hypothetical protein